MAWEIIKDTSTTKIFLVFITNPENLALKSTALFTRRIRRVGYWGGGLETWIQLTPDATSQVKWFRRAFSPSKKEVITQGTLSVYRCKPEAGR